MEYVNGVAALLHQLSTTHSFFERGKMKAAGYSRRLAAYAVTLSGFRTAANPVDLVAERLHNAAAAGRFPRKSRRTYPAAFRNALRCPWTLNFGWRRSPRGKGGLKVAPPASRPASTGVIWPPSWCTLCNAVCFASQRTDILVNAVRRPPGGELFDPLAVVIETKGCWNNELFTALEAQLFRDYMIGLRAQAAFIWLAGSMPINGTPRTAGAVEYRICQSTKRGLDLSAKPPRCLTAS
jgi:hypothetical protein